MRAYALDRTADAPIDTVFAVLADGAGWSTWTRIGETSLERQGDPAPDGVGALRLFRTGPYRTREEVTRYEPPADGSARFGYRLVSGLPVQDYRAEVTLTATGTTTAVHWEGSFTPGRRGTGRLTALFLRAAVTGLLNALVTEAERRTPA